MATRKASPTMSARDIYAELQSLPGPLYHPPSPIAAEGKIPHLQSTIASLLFHPLLESSLHLCNYSLYAPHFLLRKMQNSRGGQHLHGILHRIEGDYENARIWYRDASGRQSEPNENTNIEGEDAFVAFWSNQTEVLAEKADNSGDRAQRAKDTAIAFINRIQRLKEQSKGPTQDAGLGTSEREELEKISKAELNAFVEWAGQTYGWESWGDGVGEAKDASKAYTQTTEEQKEIFMKTMGEGMRKF